MIRWPSVQNRFDLGNLIHCQFRYWETKKYWTFRENTFPPPFPGSASLQVPLLLVSVLPMVTGVSWMDNRRVRMWPFFLLLFGFSDRFPAGLLQKSKCTFTLFDVYKVSEYMFCKLKWKIQVSFMSSTNTALFWAALHCHPCILFWFYFLDHH